MFNSVFNKKKKREGELKNSVVVTSKFVVEAKFGVLI